MQNFLENMINKVKLQKKKIVLPEGEEIRVIKATSEIIKKDIANVILLGDENTIKKKALEINVNIDKAVIINPKNSEKKDDYAKVLYEKRKHKGMTIEKSIELIQDVTYYGVIMVYVGDADGMVSGSIHSTADTLRPALHILKTSKIVSSFTIINLKDESFGEEGLLLFSDCGLNENPSDEELSEIALSSARSFRTIIQKTPRIAMLSYSSLGSANSDIVKKVRNATLLSREKDPDLIIEGEIQLDAAIIPSVSLIKTPSSKIEGKANVLIFPDLNSGNIGYKLTERFAKAKAYGPITQGLSKPVNDLSRGCNAEDIVGVVTITCLQAQM